MHGAVSTSPSRRAVNSTVPVGVTGVPVSTSLTVAVQVTAWPRTMLGGEQVTTVVVLLTGVGEMAIATGFPLWFDDSGLNPTRIMP
jgi:hypothetical protein